LPLDAQRRGMEPRDLSSHEPYVAGRGADAVAQERGLDPDDLLTLASNENQLGPAPAAVDAIREAAAGANRYPKAAHVDLQTALAERWDVSPTQVWLANGADGAIDYLARAMLDPGDRVLVPEPGFAYYGMSARFHHGQVASYPVRRADDFAVDAAGVLDAYDGERIVTITSPHSPTGSECDLAAVERIARETEPETLIVVDEAYGEFSESPSAVRLVRERDDVAVLRTFSKAYGLAGLRIGYALVPADWADAYALVNTPFAAGDVSCRAALAALEDEAHLERSVDAARWGRDHLREELDAPTWSSGGNFVLVDVGGAGSGKAVDGDATATGAGGSDTAGETPATRVSDALADRGVLVRDCTSFGLPRCIRITTGTRDETRRAAEAVNAVLGRVSA
jgi:histidinol-phosphate aminotransferase